MVSSVSLDLETTVLLASSSQAAALTVLVGSTGDPVDAGITADSLVARVDEDNLEKFESSILVDPVRVEDTEISAATSSTLFGQRLQVAVPLQANNTLIGGLTVGATIGDGLLATSTANTNTVDNVSLLGLVAETAGLIGARRSACAVHRGELAVFPCTNTQNKAKGIRLLLLVQLFKILVGTYA